jgi:hypothetical protein
MSGITSGGQVTPDQAFEELARINAILHKYGFDYPLGARGVQDLAAGYAVRQEELHRLDPEHWAPMRLSS